MIDMNLIKKNSSGWSHFTTLLILSILFFGSCSKKDDIGADSELKGDGTKISVFVASIADVADGSDVPAVISDNFDGNAQKLNNNSLSFQKENKTLGTKIVSSGGIDARLSVVDEDKHTQVAANSPTFKATSTTASSQTVNLTSTISTLPSGITYRLLLYNPDGSFKSSTLLTTGTAGSIDAAKKTTYTWFAYSYNDGGAVPDVANYATPTIPTAVNRDMLWATGTVTSNTAADNIVAPPVPISINFTHMIARLGIVLNAQGMFAGVNSGTVQINAPSLQVGTLNLKTGAITNSATAPAGTAPSSVSVRWKTAMLDTAKIAYFYTTSSATTFTNFRATVTAFSLQLDDGSTRAFTGLSSVFTFPIVTPVTGKGVLLKIDMIESPLTVNGVKWARANLWWNSPTYAGGTASNGPVYAFRHYPDSRYPKPTVNAEYWPYSALTPVPPPAPVRTNPPVDPCSLVYPAGTWRMPTKLESLSLVATPNPVFNPASPTPGTIPLSSPPQGGMVQYVSTTSTANTPYPYNNNLVIPFKGFELQGSTSVFSAGNIGQFWNSDDLKTYGAGTTNLTTVYNAGNIRFINGNGSFTDGNGNTITQPSQNGINYVNQAAVTPTLGYPCIRCVRN